MKYLDIKDIKVDMITAEAIYDMNGSIELLKMGTKITARHIQLLENVGLTIIPILEEGDEDYYKYAGEPDSDQGKLISVPEEKAEESMPFKISDKYKLADDARIKEVFKKNLKVPILTGEYNEPIDVKYEKELTNVKNIFETVRDADEIDVKSVMNNVKEMLPAMINNNDVMMRLKQLKDTDSYLFEHSLRVGILAVNVAKWMGYDEDDLEVLATACLLYEVGNLKLPPELLKKEGELTEEEMSEIQKHPQLAYHTLMRTRGIHEDIKYVALQHHERLDGSGYPLRIKSHQIHEFSKIVMVCDIFDAMVNDRPYRKKHSPFEAAEYILSESGKTLDMKVCYFFLQNLAEYYTGKMCLLNTGEKAKIIYVDINYPTRPVISLGEEIVDLSKDTKYKIVDFI